MSDFLDKNDSQNQTMIDESAGAIIKNARISAGISIEHLANLLKVSTKKIEALEENRWTDLGDSVFIRALASSVAKHLKIDQADLLKKLPATSQLPKFDEQLMSGQVNKSINFDEPAKQKYISLIVLFIVLSLVMTFIPEEFLTKDKWISVAKNIPLFQKRAEAKNNADKKEPLVEKLDTAVLKTEEVVALESGKQQSTDSAKASIEQPVGPLPPMVSGNVVTDLPKVELQANQANDVAVKPSNAENLVISATEASWIEVRDAQDKLKVQKLLNKGESIGLSGGLPYSVVIGRSDNVTVLFQGKPFDMAPYAKNNVAKFQLK